MLQLLQYNLIRDYNDLGLSGIVLTSIIYISKLAGKKRNINLTPKGEIPKNSAIPPQTPPIDLSVRDFPNLFFKSTPPSIVPLSYPILKKGAIHYAAIAPFNRRW
jgi:hypothetical protein